LDISHEKVDVDYNNNSNATLFVLDALRPQDLIDYWNLRTLQRDIVAIPVQWLAELSDYCRHAIKKAHRPMRGNPQGLMDSALVMFARSIPSADIESLYRKYLAVDVSGANARQDWYPAIWRSTPNGYAESSRPKLTAAEKTFDVPYAEDKPDIRFDSLYPEFAERYGGEHRWANVISLRDWSFNNLMATVFPTDFRDPKSTPFSVGDEIVLATTEGFVTLPRFRDIQNYWKLTDGSCAIAEWLKTANIVTRLSDSGRATQQIIQTLGGFSSVRSIANAGVVKLLNEISRKPGAKSMQRDEFIQKVNRAVQGNIWREDAARLLVERNAVELGLELKCTKCSSWSWYSLKQLDYKVSCSLCLREFSFPVLDPNGKDGSRWAYRLIGPFALPDYANGGYTAALAIRFFAQALGHHDSRVTWSAGHELTFPSGQKVEADFTLWYQRTNILQNDHPTEIVFGEAKSFGRTGSLDPKIVAKRAASRDVFQEADIARMKQLAKAFPGAVLVFATMKDAADLTKDEVARLRKLAEWGRKYISASRQTRAPVVVLTGTELFSGFSLAQAWKDKGGRHEEIVSPGYVRLDQLKTLADLTQQLYLGMPAYHVWASAKWKVHQARGKRIAKPQKGR
jgi:hypothetical protein